MKPNNMYCSNCKQNYQEDKPGKHLILKSDKKTSPLASLNIKIRNLLSGVDWAQMNHYVDRLV